jgi:serine/threonine protein kinase
VTDVGETVLVRAKAVDIERGALLAGRYQVEAVIGRGGSGIVLRAFDRVAQVPVAVKILKPDLAADPRWIERFSRELRLARQIQHAHVCRVFDIGQADGHWFITMELATGGTLRDVLRAAERNRPFEKKVDDACAVVAGLAAIHEAGIVHRDVKPDNFLRMADGRLVLSDFGLATNPSDGSMVSILVGTPAYMAPEVVLGDQSSFRSDVWSLGIVLHEIFFGGRPERSSTTNRRTIELAPERKLSSTERSLLRFIEDCLHEEATERPADAREAQRLFDNALSSIGSAPRGRRRKRASWAIPALLAATAIAAGIGTGHWWRGAGAVRLQAPSSERPSFQGTPTDWTTTSEVIASFSEAVHCVTWLEPDRVLQLVLGAPRRAVTIDVAKKAIRPSALPAQTFALGCPQLSRRGELLFESIGDAGRRHIMLAPSIEKVSEAKAVTPGIQPIWFPSGTEFAYTADDSHAAVFSIPVMTTTIVNEAADDAGMLSGKAVARNGGGIALRYIDDSLRQHVVVHEFPSLATTYRGTFEEVANNFEFVGDGIDELAFSLASPAGTILSRLDTKANVVTRLGILADRSMANPVPGHNTFLATDLAIDSDVWRVEKGVRTVRLTTDGRSYHPDVSVSGDLIVEHIGMDASSSIQLRPRGGAPKIVTNGTRDYTPRFLPNGEGWLYVDGTRRTIRRCDLAGACEDIYTSSDNEPPFHPSASPDLRHIAFVTAIGRERLKVLSQDGRVRDLGPARADCPPYWAPNDHVWVLHGTEERLAWAKIDISTGEEVATLAITDVRREPNDCPPLIGPPDALQPREAASWTSETSTIRITAGRSPEGRSP